MSGWRARAAVLLRPPVDACAADHANAVSAESATSPAGALGQAANGTTGAIGIGTNSAATTAAPDPAEAAERAAIQAEPELPPTGTSERERLDARQRRAVAGLLGAAAKRPTAWADPALLPSPGCHCSCCGGRRWWREAVAPTGWRCATCHPADHLPAAARVEVPT